MSPALPCIDVICERVDRPLQLVRRLQRDFYVNVVVFVLEVNDTLVEWGPSLVEILDELSDPASILKYVRSRLVITLVVERNLDT
jgi:hypothetical protein